MQKSYRCRAPTDATPEQLRALFERRQTARAEAAPAGRATAPAAAVQAVTQAAAVTAPANSSDRNKSDPFLSSRPPPIEEDFEAVGSKRGVPFEEARQAYKDAARNHHPDAGGDPEVMKRINAAWDRIRRSYGR